MDLSSGLETKHHSDRASDCEHADLHTGWARGAGTCRGGWGAVHRRGAGSARLSEPAGTDGGAFSVGSVYLGGGGADVPDGGSGEVVAGWEHRVPGTERRAGQDSGVPY